MPDFIHERGVDVVSPETGPAPEGYEKHMMNIQYTICFFRSAEAELPCCPLGAPFF